MAKCIPFCDRPASECSKCVLDRLMRQGNSSLHLPTKKEIERFQDHLAETPEFHFDYAAIINGKTEREPSELKEFESEFWTPVSICG